MVTINIQKSLIVSIQIDDWVLGKSSNNDVLYLESVDKRISHPEYIQVKGDMFSSTVMHNFVYQLVELVQTNLTALEKDGLVDFLSGDGPYSKYLSDE